MSVRIASVIQADLAGEPKPVRDRVMVFRLLIGLGTQLRALMDRRLSSSDITTQQAALLAVAGAADSPLTQGELASHLGVSHQNIRQLTDALERKGFLEVRMDASDRRSKRVVPTRAVSRMFARRNRADFEAIGQWFEALDDREFATLVGLLNRLAASVMAARARTAEKG